MNAIKYGAPDAPVRASMTGDETELRFEVGNAGPAIDASTVEQMFDPLRRGPEHQHSRHADSSLGLGLYIAREIAKALGGDIHVRSLNNETVFTVRLPRRR